MGPARVSIQPKKPAGHMPWTKLLTTFVVLRKPRSPKRTIKAFSTNGDVIFFFGSIREFSWSMGNNKLL